MRVALGRATVRVIARVRVRGLGSHLLEVLDDGIGRGAEGGERVQEEVRRGRRADALVEHGLVRGRDRVRGEG